MLLRSQIGDFNRKQWLFESKGKPNANVSKSAEDGRIGIIDIHLLSTLEMRTCCKSRELRHQKRGKMEESGIRKKRKIRNKIKKNWPNKKREIVIDMVGRIRDTMVKTQKYGLSKLKEKGKSITLHRTLITYLTYFAYKLWLQYFKNYKIFKKLSLFLFFKDSYI